MIASRPGGPDVLEIVEIPTPEPGSGEVRIRVRTSAVNRADLLQRRGQYPMPPGAGVVLGLEAAGTIDALGADVTDFDVGDRVMALLTDGGYAEQVVVPAGQIMRIPDTFNWILAAAVPEVYLTAWQALGRDTPAAPGDWVLVHAAASGVGIAALQIARELGARTIATTRSQAKAEILEDLADVVIHTTSAEFADQVLAHTDGAGAQVIIDLVGAAYWSENVRSLALDGRLALIGLVGGARAELDLGQLLGRRAHVIASTLRPRSLAQKAELVADFTEWGLPRLADGRLRPTIHDLIPLTRVADAHRALEADEAVGKIILVVAEDGLVPM